jgi:Fe-S-cluster containining protein
MGMRSTYFRVLGQIEQRNMPAFKRPGAKGCCRSGVCCWRRPCDLTPGDEVAIAAFLNTTPEALFKESLVVDGDPHDLRLRPRRVEQEGGKYLTSDQTFDIDTPCVFLDTANRNACRIHPVKPTTGAAFDCTKPEKYEPEGVTWSREALMGLGWDGSTEDDSDGGWDFMSPFR